MIKAQGSPFEIESCCFKNNNSREDGFDIYSNGARIASDDRCAFISEIPTQTEISIYNLGDGVFNGSKDHVLKNK